MIRSRSIHRAHRARRPARHYCTSVLDRVFVGALIAQLGSTHPMTSWSSTGDLAYLALAILLALAGAWIWWDRPRGGRGA